MKKQAFLIEITYTEFYNTMKRVRIIESVPHSFNNRY